MALHPVFQPKPRKCRNCGEEFIAKAVAQVYCSWGCRKGRTKENSKKIEKLERYACKINIADPETIRQLKELAGIQCTHAEAAAVFGVNMTQFSNWLNRTPAARELWDAAQEEGKSSLRRVQWQKAMSGNIVMLIWLGKQYLGQRDQHHNEVKVEHVDAREELKSLFDAMSKRVASSLPPEPITIEHAPQSGNGASHD